MTSPSGPSPEAPARQGSQIQEDMGFQRRTWIVERVGWIAMVALVTAALLGLFSSGPLSTATAEGPAGLIGVEYDRFQRYKAPATLRVTFTKPSGAGDTVSLRLGRSLVEALRIESVQPRPERTWMTEDALVFAFRLAAPDQAGSVFFTVKPESFGPVRGEIGLVGHEPVLLTPFIYP